MSTELSRLSELAKAGKTTRFLSLAHLLTPAALMAAFEGLRKDASAGVDDVTYREYEQDVWRNIPTLHHRLVSHQYRVQPLRRVYIPKENGKERPISIPALEDKIVQKATVTVLNAIYEQDFRSCSYGFRPGLSPHDALDAIRRTICYGATAYVLEADIQSYFDRIVRSELMAFVERRIGDSSILQLIRKWIHVGIIEDGRLLVTETGTGQGQVISPLLANIYLHYVLDEWFEHEVKPRLRGMAAEIRYADDGARPKPLLLRDERSPHHEYPKSVSSLGPGVPGQPGPSKQDRHNVLEGSATCGVVRSPGTETNLQAAIAMNDRCAPVSVYPAVIAARAGTGVAEPPVVGRRLLSMVDELGMRNHRGSRGEGGSMQGQSRGVRLETPPGPPMLTVETEDIRPEAEVPTEAWLGSRRGSYERRRRVMPLEQRAPTSVTLAREGRTA